MSGAEVEGADAQSPSPSSPGSPPLEFKVPKIRKPRIDCLDGCRVALVLPIVVATFARFGSRRGRLLKLVAQENVMVGGFFVLLGYVFAYTATKCEDRNVCERKLARPELFFWRSVMSFYPSHVLTSAIFAPLFIVVERRYKTPWKTTAFRAFLNLSLFQAWFPREGEIFNQATWLLSALTFSNFTMPFVLPFVAGLSRDGLRKLFYWLTAISMLQKLADLRSVAAPGRSPSLARPPPAYPLIWHLTRFHPATALVEMTMGILSARDAMLGGEEQPKPGPSPLPLFAAAYSTLLLRLSGLGLSEGAIRSALFVPLFARFLSALHRDSLSDSPTAITRFFGAPAVARFGSLAFPIFMLHGPIGQVFYRKSVAMRVWGRRMPRSSFPIYVLTVLLCSHAMNEGLMKSRWLRRAAARAARWLEARTEGMFQDRRC